MAEKIVVIEDDPSILRGLQLNLGMEGYLVRSASDGETGLVVPPGEAEPLADAIVELAGDLSRAARMGHAGRARVLREFTPERCVERTEELYTGALDGRHRRQRRSP